MAISDATTTSVQKSTLKERIRAGTGDLTFNIIFKKEKEERQMLWLYHF